MAPSNNASTAIMIAALLMMRPSVSNRATSFGSPSATVAGTAHAIVRFRSVCGSRA